MAVAAGVVAEYNPFHNGHALQIRRLREKMGNLPVIAVMSGSLVQRGEPAILDKWTRAHLAVEGGCDLILELPGVFSLFSAQEFASGGVSLLSRTGVADSLFFGIEAAEPSPLIFAADATETDEVQRESGRLIKQGHSYGHAFCEALSLHAGVPAEILKKPNNILAIEYLRHLKKLPRPLEPIAIPREGAGHSEGMPGSAQIPIRSDHPHIASAGAVRTAMRKKPPDWDFIAGAVPQYTLKALREEAISGLSDSENLFRPIMWKLLFTNPKEIGEIFGMTEGEGLERRILKGLRKSRSLAELIAASRSKRYPESRIRRTLMCLLMDLKRDEMEEMRALGPAYAKVLAFGERGRELLREMKQKSSIPLVTKVASALPAGLPPHRMQPWQRQLAFDVLATEIRNLSLPRPAPPGTEYLFSHSPKHGGGSVEHALEGS